MSIFGNIVSAIFGHKASATTTAAAGTTPASQTPLATGNAGKPMTNGRTRGDDREDRR